MFYWPLLAYRLTKPLITLFDHLRVQRLNYAARRDILLFQATMELNERLEGKDHNKGNNVKRPAFFGLSLQIIVLDAVFSA